MDQPDSRVHVPLPQPRTMLVCLLGCGAFILAMDVLSTVFEIHNLKQWFTFEGEGTVPAWFSSAQLLLLAGLIYAQGVRARKERSRAEAAAMHGFALAFLFLSVDETAAIHERLTFLLARVDSIPSFEGGHGIWILAYGITALALLLLLGKGVAQVARRFPADSVRFAIGASIWVFGGVGLEVMMYTKRFTGPFQSPMEECLEMAGVAVMVWAAARTMAPMELAVAHAPEPQKNSVQYTGAAVKSLEAATESEA